MHPPCACALHSVASTSSRGLHCPLNNAYLAAPLPSRPSLGWAPWPLYTLLHTAPGGHASPWHARGVQRTPRAARRAAPARRGASSGEGLGNAFLSNIAAVDGIFHVCRAFEDADVVHVEDRVDPVEDLEIIHKCGGCA